MFPVPMISRTRDRGPKQRSPLRLVLCKVTFFKPWIISTSDLNFHRRLAVFRTVFPLARIAVKDALLLPGFLTKPLRMTILFGVVAIILELNLIAFKVCSNALFVTYMDT